MFVEFGIDLFLTHKKRLLLLLLLPKKPQMLLFSSAVLEYIVQAIQNSLY